MSNTCEPLLAALKQCLLQSDCVVKDGNLPSDCLRNHTDELPESCQNLRKATFECKRGLLDMRKRFRGNNAGATAQKLQGSSSSKTEVSAPQ
ncbi:cytochrome c oxidase assembly protein PET191-domain-containing protein [Abortiporus biennis]|nr:cytochrome c oxidase assembly protein PET191-domain-containing protein [Abortiporus biennis]